jgi:hypothetical protein
MIMLPFTGRRSARPESIFAKFRRCPACPSLSSSLDRGMGAQHYLGMATSLLSFASLMLFIAPASATSGLAIASGLGSFLAALESIIARGRMIALNKELADLTSRVNQLESAEQRRLALQVKGKGYRK